jgi:sporulation protein YlmC with PRC-barrel domain
MHSVLLVVALVLACATPSVAQQTGAAPAVTAPEALQPGQVRAKALTDRDVYTTDGVKVGEIEDLILDSHGRAVSAVIELERGLLSSDQYVAVPYDRISVAGMDRKRATVAMTRDQVQAMPRILYRD